MHIKTDEEQQANEFVRLVRGFEGTVLDLWVTWAAFDVGVADALLFFGGGVACYLLLSWWCGMRCWWCGCFLSLCVLELAADNDCPTA